MLKREFGQSDAQHTTVQALKDGVEKKLQRLLAKNPMRASLQKRYEEIVVAYNSEKDRVMIEETFEALLKLAQALDDESHRATRENLDEESQAIFDLLKKPDLSAGDIKRIKKVATGLLAQVKHTIQSIDQWRDGEAKRDQVVVTIRDYLWNDETGLPSVSYQPKEVEEKISMVFRHVHSAYPTVSSSRYSYAAP